MHIGACRAPKNTELYVEGVRAKNRTNQKTNIGDNRRSGSTSRGDNTLGAQSKLNVNYALICHLYWALCKNCMYVQFRSCTHELALCFSLKP